MTPEEVAVNFHSACAHDKRADVGDVWCVTHESVWRQQHCKVMTDYIDLAEQAVEEALKDEREFGEAIAKGMVEQAVREERERAQGVVVGVTGAIQERGEALGREELLLELSAKVGTLMPAEPQSQIVHEMFVAGYSAAIAAVLGLLKGIKSD